MSGKDRRTTRHDRQLPSDERQLARKSFGNTALTRLPTERILSLTPLVPQLVFPSAGTPFPVRPPTVTQHLERSESPRPGTAFELPGNRKKRLES